MSEIKSKSEQNLKMARLSIEKTCYSTSVHCSYYACVQFMIHILYNHFEMSEEQVDKEQKRISKDLEAGFHAWIRHFFVMKLLPMEGGRIAREFSNYATQLKTMRVLADYKKKEITEQKAMLAQSYSENILKILEEHYP